MKKITFFLIAFLLLLIKPSTINAQEVTHEHQCFTNDIVDPCKPYYDKTKIQACPYPLTTDDAYCDQFNLYDNDGNLISSDLAACNEAPPTACISAFEEIPGVACVFNACRQIADINGPNIPAEAAKFPYGPGQPYPDLVSAQVACEDACLTETSTDITCTTANGRNGINTAIGCIPIDDNNAFVGFLLLWAIGISGGTGILLILVAAFQIIFSMGDPKRLSSGRELLFSAITGLLLILLSVYLIRIIGQDILQLPGL